jgi:hypothetical protein
MLRSVDEVEAKGAALVKSYLESFLTPYAAAVLAAGVKKAVTAGFFYNMAHLQKDGTYCTVKSDLNDPLSF